MQHEDIDHRSLYSSDEDAKEGDTRKEYQEGRKGGKAEAKNYDDKALDVRYVSAQSQAFMLKEDGPLKSKETHQIGDPPKRAAYKRTRNMKRIKKQEAKRSMVDWA